MIPKSNLENIISELLTWVHTYVQNSGVDGAIVGNSGGKDSATVIAILAHALGKEHVLSVSMPCSSISQDLKDAQLVADAFGIPLLTVPLTDVCSSFEDAIQEPLQHSLNMESRINIKPRLRMTTLYAIAQTFHYLVAGTSNLCERMVGYTTKWGDSACDFNPIANFTVEEVKQIGSYLGVPAAVLYKAPNDGLGGITDEEKMGITYDQITEYIETGKIQPNIMKKIEKRYLSSLHKRKDIPTFAYLRTNYLERKFM